MGSNKKHSKIIIDIINNQISISDALFRLKILLSDLGDESIERWVHGELEGFKTIDDVPPYRIINVHLFGKLRQVTMRNLITQDLLIPVKSDFVDINKTRLRENITILEKWAKDEGNDKKIPVDLRLANNIADLEINDHSQIISAWLAIPPASYSEIINSVKMRILDILLDLEKRYDTIDEYLIPCIGDKEKESVTNVIKNIIYQDNSVKIGDNNTIEKSIVGDKNEHKNRKKE